MIATPSSAQQVGGLPENLKAGFLNFMNALGLTANNAFTQGIPVVQAPSGTITAGGVITLGTALPAIYAKCWLFLPAGAVVGGAAGCYFTKMSSTTVGQVFTNFNAATSNFFPTDPEATQPSGVAGVVAVAATGSGGAVTNVVATDSPLLAITIPAGSLSLNGQVRIDSVCINNNSAGAKTAKIKFGATTVASTASTTDVAGSQAVRVQNRGNAASQVVNTKIVSAAAIAVANSYATINTAVDVLLQIATQVATATDYTVLEMSTIELISNG